MLEFRFLIIGFWAGDLEFGMLDLEFSSLEVWVWDFVLGIVIGCLRFGILDFEISSLGFWVWVLEFGV